MTLRLRLVVALVALVTVAQGAFFAGTYVLYRNSEYQRLDAQLRSSEPVVDAQLDQEAAQLGQTTRPSNSGDGGAPGVGAAPVVVPPGTYAELLDPHGKLIANDVSAQSSSKPKLPSLSDVGPAGKLLTVHSTSGSGSFRVFAVASHGGADTTVIAIPTTEVTSALHRLVLIEAVADALLLIILSSGAWAIIRRGLRPLERIAGTAQAISGGDLSQRVTLAGGGSEVGQVALALNTMLADIEAAFAEREATEARLRQFLADVSHELRTPLTSILGFAELFRISGGDNSRVDLPTILRRIEEESARMRVLVEELLLLARLDQTRPPERSAVDLSVVASDACSDAVATDPRRPVRLNAPYPTVVAGDQAHLRQAVANLVTNALRHTPPATPIAVTVALADGEAVLSVRDHGPGLDAQTATHAFDRFWQADTARSGAGFGLGLSIVAAVAHEHGGTATAANAPGGGAVFTLRLPIEPGDAHPPPRRFATSGRDGRQPEVVGG